LETVEFASIEKAKDPIEKLRKVMQAYYEFNENNPDFVKLTLWENLNNGVALKNQKQYFAKNTFLNKFLEIIDEGIEEGIFRKEINSKHLLIEFIGLCFIYYSNTSTLSSALGINLRSKRHRKEALNNSLDLIFKGILSKPSIRTKSKPSRQS
jgi:TetR/AcrR family transcriptional regulator